MSKLESPLNSAARAIGDTREGVFVAIDLVRFTGDVLSALMLGQLLYWFGTGRDGYCRAQVKVKLTDDDVKKGTDPALADVAWLAKGDEAWFEETGLTAAQARRVRAVFERDGWVATITKRFAGTPTTHITILPKLLDDLAAWYAAPAEERVRRSRITWSRSSAGAQPREDANGNANDASPNGLGNDASPFGNDADGSRAVAATITDDLHTTSNPPTDLVVDSVADRSEDDASGPFDVVAEGFGYDLVGLPDAIRNKIRGTLRQTKLAGLHADLDRLAGLVWLFRARGGKDPGKFGSAAAVLDRDEDAGLIEYRNTASMIVDEALSRVADLNGRCKGVTRPEAELAIAAALAAGNSRGAVKTAMLTAPQWGRRTLLNEVGRLGSTRPGNGRPAAPVPAVLADQTDAGLVDLMKSNPTFEDLARVFTEITARLEHVDGQVERIAGFRHLLGGKDGWPRGGGGHVNEARFKLAAWCEDWLSVNAASTPALMRGA